MMLVVWGLGKTASPASSVTVTEDLSSGARWVKDNGEVKVTVVEFSDLQCPACRVAEPVARELRNMPGVRFVYRHFPLTMLHQNAWKAARAAEAANSLGKGFEMASALYDSQDKWSEMKDQELSAKFKELAVGIGLDGETFMAAFLSPDSEKGVKLDSDLATKLKLNGTPSFFVNGKLSASNLIVGQVKQILSAQ